MRKLITRKQPIIMLWKEELLNSNDWFIINRVYKMQNYTILYDYREHISINPAIKDSKELVEVVRKIFEQKYLCGRTEKLLDEVEKMTDKQIANNLVRIWIDWKANVAKLELNEQAQAYLKEIKSNRLYHKAKKNKEVIKELFDIGFGIYDDKATCNYQQGAENAFMYGYLLGMKANRKAV